MPEGNESAYKEMYEMGERLMQMAKDGGYSPEGSETEEYGEKEEYSAKPMDSGSKVNAALSFMK